MFNTYNLHYWDEDNYHVTWNRGSQVRFSVNIWCGIFGGHLIGPHVMHCRLTGRAYLGFLQDTLALLLDDVPLQTRRQLWLMHNGAPAHRSILVRDYLNQPFPGRWIGHGGPFLWQPRSPDLNLEDFFLWGHVKALVYSEYPIESEYELLLRIINSSEEIRNKLAMLQNVMESMIRHCNLCIEVGGGHVEHLL